ncbi:hypothetical protein [Zhongshania arctica]|uniref:Uncharacterized protein n=1 Tax=Zhongshania arctica TaxID=3238302 RepID=A0ABV3TS07_9GAMM
MHWPVARGLWIPNQAGDDDGGYNEALGQPFNSPTIPDVLQNHFDAHVIPGPKNYRHTRLRSGIHVSAANALDPE